MVLVVNIRYGRLEALYCFLPSECLVAKDRTCDRSSRNHGCSCKLCLMGSTLALDPGRHLDVFLYCMRRLVYMRSEIDCGYSD